MTTRRQIQIQSPARGMKLLMERYRKTAYNEAFVRAIQVCCMHIPLVDAHSLFKQSVLKVATRRKMQFPAHHRELLMARNRHQQTS